MVCSEALFGDDDQLHDDFEDWETESYYLDRQDYSGLLTYRKQCVQRRPNDLYAQIALGEAYNLAGDYHTAMAFLTELHRRHPHIPDIQHLILDALFATHRTEDDFSWTRKPTLIRLTSAILDWCYGYLQPKRKPRFVEELYAELIPRGYLCFSVEDLFNALEKDSRFLVEASNEGWRFATVKAARRAR